jgi:hypothetical protein
MAATAFEGRFDPKKPIAKSETAMSHPRRVYRFFAAPRLPVKIFRSKASAMA